MSVLTQALDKPRIFDRKAEKAKPLEKTGGPKGCTPSGEMPKQLESPLYALINRRERLPLDEIPALQLESPLYALINRRERLTLAELETQAVEYRLNQAINQREPQSLADLPAQKESPLNAAINGHSEQHAWRKSKQKKG